MRIDFTRGTVHQRIGAGFDVCSYTGEWFNTLFIYYLDLSSSSIFSVSYSIVSYRVVYRVVCTSVYRRYYSGQVLKTVMELSNSREIRAGLCVLHGE